MATPPEKYLFDQEFEHELPEEERNEDAEEVEEIDPLLYTDDDLAAAVEQARGEGHAAGLAQAQSETAHHAAKLLEIIPERLAVIQQTGTVTREEARLEAVELAYLIARKLARSIIERVPQADVEQMVAICLRELAARTEAPKVRISVPEQLATHITEHVANLTPGNGFDGEIIIVGDASMELSDCRVQWEEGGAERKGTEVEQLVDDAVQRFLQSHQTAIDPLRNPAEAIERAADAADFGDTEPRDNSIEVPLEQENPAADPTAESEVANVGEAAVPASDSPVPDQIDAGPSPLDGPVDQADGQLENGATSDATGIPQNEQ